MSQKSYLLWRHLGFCTTKGRKAPLIVSHLCRFQGSDGAKIQKHDDKW